MAHKLPKYSFERTSTLTRADKATYPWSEWLDGDIWQLTVGEDFSTHPLMMERIIRTRATGRGAKVRLRHEPLNGDDFGVIVLQRTDILGPAESKRAEAREKRQAKKEAAEKAASETLAKAGIKTTKSKTPAKVPAKRPVKKVA